MHLGCSTQEKFHPQMVSLNIDIYFSNCPTAAYTDILDDTICYSKLTTLITEHCDKKHFNLIEKLTEEIYQIISSFLLPYVGLIKSIKVQTNKLSPPVANIHGGVSWMHHINIINK